MTISLSSLAVTYKSKLWRNKIATRWVTPLSPPIIMVSPISPPLIMVSPVSPPLIMVSLVSHPNMLVSSVSPPNTWVSPVSHPSILVSSVSHPSMWVSSVSPPEMSHTALLQEEDGQEGSDQQQVRHHLQPDHVRWHVRGAVSGGAGLCCIIQ